MIFKLNITEFSVSAKKLFLSITVCLILFLTIYVLGLPIWLDVFATGVFAFLMRFNPIQIILTSIFLAIGISVLNFFSNIDPNQSTAYRDHEKYIKANGFYESNVNDLIEQPFGDLYVIDGGESLLREIVKEPRNVVFKTDRHGFRNDLTQLEEADIVLAGDSFIVANGVTQNQIPSAALSKILSKPVASIAIPSDPTDYENNILRFLPKLKPSAKIIVFYFEGNDFPNASSTQEKFTSNIYSSKNYTANKYFGKYLSIENIKDYHLSLIVPKSNKLIRQIRAKSHVLNDWLFRYYTGINSNKVTYIKVGGKYMAFYTPYILAAKNSQDNLHIFQNPDVIKRVASIYFIPTKYRVYSKALNDNSLSDSTFETLKSKYKDLKIPVFNLSDCLEDAALSALKENKYLFWRDDTHWNGEGIDVAMHCVAKQLQ